MGIENILARENVLSIHDQPVLVGCGTDGASVNVSDQNGMRGKLNAGCFGHGATPSALNLHARMPFPVVSSKILMKCF